MSEQEMSTHDRIMARYDALELKQLERMERREEWESKHPFLSHPYFQAAVFVIVVLGVMLFMKHFIIEA